MKGVVRVKAENICLRGQVLCKLLWEHGLSATNSAGFSNDSGSLDVYVEISKTYHFNRTYVT